MSETQELGAVLELKKLEESFPSCQITVVPAQRSDVGWRKTWKLDSDTIGLDQPLQSYLISLNLTFLTSKCR